MNMVTLSNDALETTYGVYFERMISINNNTFTLAIYISFLDIENKKGQSVYGIYFNELEGIDNNFCN